MARSLEDLLVSEMTQEERDEYAKQWIASWAESLQVEADFSEEDARERAELDWEKYCGQEGHAERDERIAMRREAKDGKR